MCILPPLRLRPPTSPSPFRPAIRVHPIMVSCISDAKNLCGKISSLIGTELNFKIVNDYIKVTTCSMEDRNALIDALRREKLQFYSPTSTINKPLKVVFKGIYRGIDSADVRSEIEKLGFNGTDVTQMRRLHNREKLPMFLVTLPKPDKVDESNNIRTLFSLSIEVVKYEAPARVNKCHNCQRFLNGSAVCSM
ncbi:hypothetical protein JTE90_011659 [Oedothorax gibbosus]|uniref:Pre-C2HC domain-containing protein n=1 Tax=Oedothorax gibbosus TaxID=931172 RepID=A0AAV6TTV5_9ARAC|nr:hypothetical protein JTE90_011659 [Oedothorax gibbosus]